MKTMIKTSLKLLFRMKLMWLFLIVAPILSTAVLKSKVEFTSFAESSREIVELSSPDEKVGYYGGKGEYVIKVYDASKTGLSDHLLNSLIDSGLFTVCRADVRDKEINDGVIRDQTEFDAFEDRMGAALYISPDFDEKILNADADDAIRVFILSDDGRKDAMINELKLQLSEMTGVVNAYSRQGMGELTAEDLVKQLNDLGESLPDKETVTVAGGKERVLTNKQNDQKSKMGYAFVFMTLASVFAGFFVAYTSIKEQKNGVLTRINLTKSSVLQYFASKIVTVFIVSAILTVIEAICSLVLDMDDLGMGRGEFIMMVFMIGLVFSEVTMFIGILMGEIMSACMASFSFWIIASLFGGLFFPMTHTSAALKAISMMMPPKWFLDGTEMILVGEKGSIGMLICVTLAYVIATLSMGSLGLKVRKA